MKKAFLAISAVALLFATSCKKDLNAPEDVSLGEGEFLATIDNNANPQNAPVVSDGMSTKTTIYGNYYVIWDTGDQISINGSGYTTSKAGNSVVFSGGNATGSTFHAFYAVESPSETAAEAVLPATQICEEGRVNNLPMYATCGNDRMLVFHNICAALKVKVPIACDSIVISADENICGDFTVDATTYTAQLTETGEHLRKSLKAVKNSSSFAANEIVYIAIPAGEYTNFSVKFYAAESIVGQKSLASLTVEVNKVYNLKIPMEFCFTYVKQGQGQTNCTISLHSLNPYSGDPTTSSITLETCTYTASTKSYSDWASYTVGNSIVLNNVGDKVYFRAGNGGNTTLFDSSDGISVHMFRATDTVEVSGNIMTLLSQTPSTTFPSGSYYNFCSLFAGVTTLKSAENLVLPATTLTNGCYSAMFKSCESLTTAPVLPATTLTASCYSGMFEDCISLTAPPVLPATTLADYCYSNMFDGCKSLTTAPTLPATTLAESCYSNMFEDCISLTALTVLPATTLAVRCYSNMFDGCKSLTTAPRLPAINLTTSCYQNMFEDCISLTAPPVLSATTLADCCYAMMFKGCKSLTTAPTLPAITLTAACYQYMFQDCSNLTSVTMKATDVVANNCLLQWLFYAGKSASAPLLKVNDAISSSHTAFSTIDSETPAYWGIETESGTNLRNE